MYVTNDGKKIGTVRKNVTIRQDLCEAVEMRYGNMSRLVNEMLLIAVRYLDRNDEARKEWLAKENIGKWIGHREQEDRGQTCPFLNPNGGSLYCTHNMQYIKDLTADTAEEPNGGSCGNCLWKDNVRAGLIYCKQAKKFVKEEQENCPFHEKK